jgi:non-ribosomal peptide synthetase component F
MGESVDKDDVELYKKHFPSNCLLVNTYAAVEVGTIRMLVIDKETRIAGQKVPVGYEIPDKEVILLDDKGQEVGFNQVGEIAVKSRYLSLGFWRRPDLTQGKFLPDPNGGDKRIYLTGEAFGSRSLRSKGRCGA